MVVKSGYFSNVEWYRLMTCAEGDVVFIDATGRYVKQTERNHCRIATANGVQKLTVPVTIPEGAKTIHDILVSEHGNWRHQHWEALKSAYGMSPFFEYYQDDIRPFFEKQENPIEGNDWRYLLDFNTAITRKMFELLGINKEIRLIYNKEQTAFNKDSELFKTPPLGVCGHYYQTFQRRHGFIPGLSILDLLFNEGPEAIKILMK